MRAPLVILVLFLILWIASVSAQPRAAVYRQTTTALKEYSLGVRGGHIWAYFVKRTWPPGMATTHRTTMSFDCDWGNGPPLISWAPGIQIKDITRFSVPFWLLVFPLTAWLTFACWRVWKKRAGLCPCGYDTRGLDVCPECGRDAKA